MILQSDIFLFLLKKKITREEIEILKEKQRNSLVKKSKKIEFEENNKSNFNKNGQKEKFLSKKI